MLGLEFYLVFKLTFCGFMRNSIDRIGLDRLSCSALALAFDLIRFELIYAKINKRVTNTPLPPWPGSPI